jgi:phage tail tube protein FII
MSINGMQLGSDLTLVIVDSVQGLQSFSNITMTNVKQKTKNIRDVGMDGGINLAEIPDGWTMDIDITVRTPALMDYVMANEAAYYAGQQVGTITGTTMATYPDGSERLYRLTGGALKLGDGGSFKGQEKVTQKASLEFARGYNAT